jgi:chorismate--pyruvate lyase
VSSGRLISWRNSTRPPYRCDARLAAWLRAPGSLTAHLSQSFGAVRVQRLRQGAGRAQADEARVLGLRPGRRVHVREVVLRCQGRALVMARSVCEPRHLRGAWRALKGLGSRPLASLLFTDRQVSRLPLSYARLPMHQRRGRARLSAWQAATGQPWASPGGCGVWQRRSVFRRRGACLLVAELFSPEVQARAPIANLSSFRRCVRP